MWIARPSCRPSLKTMFVQNSRQVFRFKLAWMRSNAFKGFCALFFILLLFALGRMEVFNDFPASWRIPFLSWLDDFADGAVSHLSFFFGPFRDGLGRILVSTEASLLGLPWWLVLAGAAVLPALLGNVRLGILGACGLTLMGLVGMWEATLSTLALMAMAVCLSVAIGVPLGILASRSDTVDTILRPLLDLMQTIPTYVYLIPMIVLFGVGQVPGLVATVIYALPPAIRLTNLGIRQVSPALIEVARSHGSTPFQVLFKVELPMALPAILAGINQAVMMALSMVVIAALVGTRGLGYEVFKGVERLELGRAVEGGIGILFLAVFLDRLSQQVFAPDARDGFRQGRSSRRLRGNHPRLLFTADGQARFSLPLLREWKREAEMAGLFRFVRSHGRLLLTLGVLLVLVALQAILGNGPRFPLTFSLNAQVHRAILWMGLSLRFATEPISDVIFFLHDRLETFLQWLPWIVVVGTGALFAGFVGGWRLGLFTILVLLFIGLQGPSAFPPKTTWDLTMTTFSLVLLSTGLSVGIGISLGILASRYDRFRAALQPMMDAMQVIPTFVYLVPMVMLFGIGDVSSVLATTIYAFPPAARLTDLGIRMVPLETLEAAKSFGSTSQQTLMKVQLPLAMPSILLGISQTVMMVLAMVIVASLIGGGGLGLEILRAKSFLWLGRGMEAGLDIAFIAMLIDRVVQRWVGRREAFLMLKR